ncbi:MAG: hypothetical protein ACOYMN_14680 [Roseimicrobium sp.]
MKTYTIEEARETLLQLAKQAYEQEPIVLVDGARLLILRSYDPPETPWSAPPNYYEGIYSPEEIELDNLMAKASVQPLDRDDVA